MTAVAIMEPHVYEDYITQASILHDYKKWKEGLSLFPVNTMQLLSTLGEMTRVTFNRPKEDEIWKVRGEANRLAVNVLSSLRLFLDQTETRLSRSYGKESMQYRALKSATAYEYDNNFAYRFAYHLRNYTLHCGMPINHITVSSEAIDSQRTEAVVNRYQIGFSPQTLLKEFEDWKRAKPDLEASTTWIDAASIFSVLPASFERIRDTVHRVERESLRAAGQRIVDIVRPALSGSNGVALGYSNPKPGSFKQTLREVPMRTLYELGLIDAPIRSNAEEDNR